MTDHRKYDADLVASMRSVARMMEKRSAKVAVVLRQGADRIEALGRAVDYTDQSAQQPDIQPASTPI